MPPGGGARGTRLVRCVTPGREEARDWTEDRGDGMLGRLLDRTPASSSRFGLLRYVLAWACGGVIVIAAVLILVGRGDDDAVTLPPVRQIELATAARTAGCELRTGDGSDVLGLPVSGAPGRRPTPAGVYDDPPNGADLVAALRRGVIVIQHRADLPEDAIDELRALQKAIPDGTIVTPEPVRTRFAVAVVAWRRLLGCRSYVPGAVDAIRLFRGRYIGSGPDRPG